MPKMTMMTKIPMMTKMPKITIRTMMMTRMSTWKIVGHAMADESTLLIRPGVREAATPLSALQCKLSFSAFNVVLFNAVNNVQCNASQHNVMQCNLMQCNAK